MDFNFTRTEKAEERFQMMELIKKFIFPLKLIDFTFECDLFGKILQKNHKQCRNHCDVIQAAFSSLKDHANCYEEVLSSKLP